MSSLFQQTRPVVLLAVCLLAACAAPRYVPRAIELDQNSTEIWEAVVKTAIAMGYRPDPRNSDRSDRVFESRWRTHNAAFGKGTRHRLHVALSPKPESVSGWIVEYYVEQQSNASMARAMNPKEEDWEPAGQVGDKELIFAARLRGNLGMSLVEVENSKESSR